MKTTSILRQKTSLQDTVLEILNQQMGVEAHSSALYLSMSAWCYAQGLRGCGEFFRKQAAEEREHMMKIFNYISHAGALAVSPEVTNVERGFEDLRSILVMALDQEISITENFNKMTEHCQRVRDFQTARFLQWYLDEQYEEEQTARRCLEIFDLMNAKDALYDIDREIHNLKKKD
ncbi:MAG: ferritin [Chryseolinea sp.]